jgi:hypothetical protein
MKKGENEKWEKDRMKARNSQETMFFFGNGKEQ